MFDTHCHLQTEQFSSDREAVIQNAEALGVTSFLVPAIDYASFEGTLDVAASHTNVYCALGIHPHSASEWNEEIGQKIITEAKNNPKVRAVGEIGLDYFYDFAPRDVQIRAFREQIELAKVIEKPIIIHTRDSIDETLEILEDCYKSVGKTYLFGQLHCFSGTVEQMQRAVEAGFCVSYTGNITFKNSTLTDSVRETPIDRILVETDSPYLAPVPHRGKRNSPEYLPLIAQKIAEIKSIDINEVMTRTTHNAKRLFLGVASLLLILLAGLSSDAAHAQVGSRPPDSVMTKDRRDAEEMIKKQRDQLLKLDEERRQDSIKSARQEEEDQRIELMRQVQKDSARAAQRIADDEKARLRALTPIPWKAISIGASGGIGNLELSQSKARITPTAVFAHSFLIGTQISRIIDLEVSYNSFKIDDDLKSDNLYNLGENTFSGGFDTSKKYPSGYNKPTHEYLLATYIGVDFRFVFTPRSPLKFYAGLGYTATTITNNQTYDVYDSSRVKTKSDQTFESSFSHGGIKGLIGVRYDYELSDQFILSPFVQIGAAFLFASDGQKFAYVFRTAADQIVFSHTSIGVSLSFGWFTVPRYK